MKFKAYFELEIIIETTNYYLIAASFLLLRDIIEALVSLFMLFDIIWTELRFTLYLQLL